MNTPGKLIVLEGVNYAGKGTFQNRLTAELTSRGYSVVASNEPGGSEFGQYLRKGLKTMEGVCDFARALGMNASRAQNECAIIMPAIARGDIVISDRWRHSTDVFQVELGSLREDQRIAIEVIHGCLPKPDLTIFLLPSIELIEARMAAAKNRETDVFEKNPRTELAAYERVLERDIAAGETTVVLRYNESEQDDLINLLLAREEFQLLFPIGNRAVA